MVATLSTTDPGEDGAHTYELVTGDGGADNNAFIIDGDKLKMIDSPGFQVQLSYSIRLQTTDSGGLTFAKSFTFVVEPPTPTEEDAVE